MVSGTSISIYLSFRYGYREEYIISMYEKNTTESGVAALCTRPASIRILRPSLRKRYLKKIDKFDNKYKLNLQFFFCGI